MKAKLLKSLRINGKIVSPIPGAHATLVNLDEAEFGRLKDLGKVSEPTKDDLAIGHLVGEASDETEKAETAASTKKSGAAKKAGAPKADAPVTGTEPQSGDGQQPGADDL